MKVIRTWWKKVIRTWWKLFVPDERKLFVPDESYSYLMKVIRTWRKLFQKRVVVTELEILCFYTDFVAW
jgi:hypothetical protein